MSEALNEELLTIYLNDHLGGATGGVELARRAASENEGNELGAFLSELASTLEDDRDAVQALMSARGMTRNPAKIVGGWAIEKLSRLKLNGSLVGYTPLSRVVELEGLLSGTIARAGLFELLAAIEDAPGEMSYSQRAKRAHEQEEKLRVHLQRAYEGAFMTSEEAPEKNAPTLQAHA